jgi:TonB family protein
VTESVTDIIAARARRRERLTPMVVVSLAVHLAVFGAAALISLRAETEPPPNVFKVSFNTGSPGPRTGGENPMGGRRIDRVAPPEPVKAVERPPAPIPPKMTVPEPKAKPAPKPERPARADEPAVVRPPSVGDEVRAGTTKVETEARGPGFGLSSGGAIGSNQATVEVSNFCCKEYIEIVLERIEDGWDKDIGRRGSVIIRFTVRRDGSVTSATVHQTSGFAPLDESARRAVQVARLPPLPRQFTDEALTIRLTFNYER